MASIEKTVPTENEKDAIVNAMSVDVEEHYHAWALSNAYPRTVWSSLPSRVAQNTDRILGMFEDASASATFFVLGSVAQRYPELMRQIVARGHELASHGFDHVRVTDQSRDVFLEDVSRTKKILEDVSGTAVRGYRAASFSIQPDMLWAYDVLQEAGYQYSSSVHPISHDHYGSLGVPRHLFRPQPGGIVEVPVATAELFGRRFSCAGGGYFRLLPYPWSRSLIDRVIQKEKRPVAFYFHPWEIDPEQPKAEEISLKSRFRHYVNLGRMEKKLSRLLRRFAWSRFDRVFGPEI